MINLKYAGNYVVIGLGLLFLGIVIKIIVQDDTITNKDIIAIIIGIGLGIPMVFGSISIIQKKEKG